VIFDEVKTGFRTSLGGAQKLLGVTPDLATISKGMGNGYPIAAVVGKKKYMKHFPQTPTAGTFSVEAFSIAAAVAVIREMREKKVVEHLWKMGQRLIDGLNVICRDHGIEGPEAYPDPVPSMPRFTWRPRTEDFSHPAHRYFFAECYRHGLFYSSWHVSFVNYSHKSKDIDEALEICDFVMDTVKKRFY
jgi:glutamate-1-semialdehyde aminotransferase